MEFTEQQKAELVALLEDRKNAKRIDQLPTAEGKVDDMRMIVQDASGETRQMGVRAAMDNAVNPIAGRRWNENNSTPTAAGHYGSLEALRDLPRALGLGRYLVTDDRVRRKLAPEDSTRFEDGSPVLLDGSMGQCMWCWNEHWYTTWKEGNDTIEAVTFAAIPGKKSIKVPAGGISWLGHGVMDRVENKLASVISDDPRYRGGSGKAIDHTVRTKLSEDMPQCSMLGMPATAISTRGSGELARARGEGWEGYWYVAAALVGYLERIILGTRNIQAPFNPTPDANGLYQGGLGPGVTRMPGWTEYNGVYPLIPTSAGLAMGDGVGVETCELKDKDGGLVYAAPVPVFFGLVHAGYGHLHRGVRGLIIDIGETQTFAYVAPSMFKPFDDKTTEGLLRAAELPRKGGYIKKLSMNLLCCLPTETGATESTYYCDEYGFDPNSRGLRVRLSGGNSDWWSTAGAAYTNAWHAATTAYSNFSAPLCYFKEDPVMTL